MPSPCGPYSICKEINGHGVCSCQVGYIGSPPTCRPECVVSTDCPQHQACIKQKCVDPCPGTCGVNARCQTINHNPICTCKAGFTGDPFVTCQLDQSKRNENIKLLLNSNSRYPTNCFCITIGMTTYQIQTLKITKKVLFCCNLNRFNFQCLVYSTSHYISSCFSVFYFSNILWSCS